MDKIEYIQQLANTSHLFSDDSTVLHALIFALSPRQATNFLDLSFEQNYKIRQWVVKKIANDISKDYQPFHNGLVSTMLEMLQQRPFPKRESCAYSLTIICDSLPKERKDELITAFLNSSYIRIRNRAYNQLFHGWDEQYQKKIEKNWLNFKDADCVKIILYHFPTDYLLDNYKGYIDYFEPYQISKLFLRMSEKDLKIANELKDIDEISYTYVLTKLEKKLSDKQARRFLHDNYQDKRIGLLIWCFGQMGLWDAIVDYENNYKKKYEN